MKRLTSRAADVSKSWHASTKRSRRSWFRRSTSCASFLVFPFFFFLDLAVTVAGSPSNAGTLGHPGSVQDIAQCIYNEYAIARLPT